MDKCCQLRDFSLSILQRIGSKVANHLKMISNNGARLGGSSRTVGKPLNPRTDFLDTLENRGQRLLLSEAISNALARYLKHPVEGLPSRFIRQIAAQACATQFKKSPAQLFPVLSRRKPFLLRKSVDERGDQLRCHMPVSIGDPLILLEQLRCCVVGDLLHECSPLPADLQRFTELHQQPGTFANRCGECSLSGGYEEQLHNRCPEGNESVAIHGSHEHSSTHGTCYSKIP
ncbi:hypothetical protein BKH21_08455 [Actinomyces oris]|nr:hypothetical protein BKH21_08455 [Actinomyces oris]